MTVLAWAVLVSSSSGILVGWALALLVPDRRPSTPSTQQAAAEPSRPPRLEISGVAVSPAHHVSRARMLLMAQAHGVIAQWDSRWPNHFVLWGSKAGVDAVVDALGAR